MFDDFTLSLEAARVNAELTQDQASTEIGVTKQTLLNWEKGNTEPNVSQFRKMSEIYKIPLDRLRMPIKSNLI